MDNRAAHVIDLIGELYGELRFAQARIGELEAQLEAATAGAGAAVTPLHAAAEKLRDAFPEPPGE